MYVSSGLLQGYFSVVAGEYEAYCKQQTLVSLCIYSWGLSNLIQHPPLRVLSAVGVVRTDCTAFCLCTV